MVSWLTLILFIFYFYFVTDCRVVFILIFLFIYRLNCFLFYLEFVTYLHLKLFGSFIPYGLATELWRWLKFMARLLTILSSHLFWDFILNFIVLFRSVKYDIGYDVIFYSLFYTLWSCDDGCDDDLKLWLGCRRQYHLICFEILF